MSELGIHEGCYVQLGNGDVVGPVQMRPYNRERAPSAFYDDRICEWNPRGQWTDGDDNNPKNMIRVVSKEVLKLAVSKEYGQLSGLKATIPPHVLQAAMGAGIKAEPAYEQFVSAILEAGFKAQYGIEFVPVGEKPTVEVTDELLEQIASVFGDKGFYEWSDVGQQKIRGAAECVISYIARSTNLKNESEIRIQDSEKTKGGPSDPVDESGESAGFTTLRTTDKIHPITAAFLKFLYPDAPLRAVEFCDTGLRASYGRPMSTVAEIEVKVSQPGKIPMWVEDGDMVLQPTFTKDQVYAAALKAMDATFVMPAWREEGARAFVEAFDPEPGEMAKVSSLREDLERVVQQFHKVTGKPAAVMIFETEDALQSWYEKYHSSNDFEYLNLLAAKRGI
jgi:hypothetical protein